jgi:hypothetical protein
LASASVEALASVVWVLLALARAEQAVLVELEELAVLEDLQGEG